LDARPAPASALFVQPHFDDIALSCGGTVALRSAEGERVTIVTVFAERPPPGARVSALARRLEKKWGTGERTVLVRRAEDAAAAAVLGAGTRWLSYCDAIYRGRQYASYRSLMGAVSATDLELVERIAGDVVALWRDSGGALVHLPLAVGGHVDHQLCHALAPWLRAAGARVCFYEDFPYAAVPEALDRRLREIDLPLGPRTIDITATLDTRLRAIAAYGSQLPFLFPRGSFRRAVRDHGARLSPVPGRYAERLWDVEPQTD
jgi:LmbE family N-acetylglucosaminyl deacetylase